MGYDILLVNWRDISHPEAGGAEVHAHEIFRRIAARGHRVTLLCAAWPGCSSREEIDGIEVLRRGRNLTFNYSVPGLIRRELGGRPFDILVEDVNKIPFCTPWYSRLPKLILFHHLFGASIFRETVAPVAAYVYLWERMIPFIYRGEPVQAVSRDTADELAGMGFDPRRMRVVHNGIDCARYTPAPPDGKSPRPDPYILYMGRIKRYKRLDLILDAFALAAAGGLDPRVRLVFGGFGDDAQRLKKIALRLGLGGRTDFLGRIDGEEKVTLLRYALAVANPSPKEGWGITNLEAAACGAPVVASRSPGLRESVRAGITGFLFTPGDVKEFASRLLEVAGDESLRRRLGQAGRQFAGTFTWEQAAEETLAHITDILEHRA
jgi:glycosyltransferase involved in cell wall biosynthesis